MISALIVALTSFAAALGCVFYAYTRGQRKKRLAWALMAIPCVFHGIVYTWILIGEPELASRIFPVRLSIIIENAFLAYLTIMLSVQKAKP